MARHRPIHSIIVSKDASRATVHTRVEQFYRSFLDDIDPECKSENEAFKAHLQIIIWGLLYLEGLSNFKLYRYTEHQFIASPALVPSYWQLTKQARLEDKITLLFSADGVQRPWVPEAMKKLTRIIEQRNRLVHFKDAPTQFAFTDLRRKLETNAPLAKWFEHVPDPRIVSDLLAVLPLERKTFIQNVGDRLEEVHVG